MKRQELITHLQQSSENFADILKAAELPPELQEFNPEQVKGIEAIAQLVATKQVKTFKEAGELYRKSLHEVQLNEAVVNHKIAPEQILDILKALKFKVETLTDAQVEQFTEVCKQIQSGIELTLAAQTTLEKAKTNKTKKAAAPQTNGAIAVAQSNTIQDYSPSAGDDPIFEAQLDLSGDMSALAKDSAIQMAEQYVQGAATRILSQDPEKAFQQGEQFGQLLVEQARREVINDPATNDLVKRVVANVKKSLGQK
jgi:hypothetical protein